MVFGSGGGGGFRYMVDLQWGWWFAIGFLDLGFVGGFGFCCCGFGWVLWPVVVVVGFDIG